MRIFVDMDETLFSFMPKALYYHNSLYGTEYTVEDITEWDLPGDRKEWEDIFRIPGFHADLDWVDPDAPEVIALWETLGDEVYIATSPPVWEAARDKYSLVHTRFVVPGILPGMHRLVITRDKSILRGDILIDDNLEHLRNFEGIGIAYDRPWNREWGGLRVYSWEHLRALVGFLRGPGRLGKDGSDTVSASSPTWLTAVLRLGVEGESPDPGMGRNEGPDGKKVPTAVGAPCS